ncbi:hypothetical protein JCM5353_008450 [Sporobolomyces roseus]
MSTALPPELQEDIIADLKKPDLASLCLVSKYLLHLARPLLFRSIKISVHSWQRTKTNLVRELVMAQEEDPVPVINEMQIGFEERECRQNKLIQTLEAHEDWKDSVQQISLGLITPVEDTNQASQIGRLLSSCRNLQSLSINSAYDKATESFFLHRSFFSTITSSTNSLFTLVVDFIATQALVPERLSTITSLSILGELYPMNLRYGDYSQNLVSNLAGVFNGCHSLRYLKIAPINMMGGSSQVGNSEFAKVLPHLPKHLETLVLSSIDFGGDHLADFLSAPHRHLRQLDCSRISDGQDEFVLFGDTSFDEEGEDRIETICEARGIRLNWIGGRIKGQRDEGISLSGLQGIMAAFSKLA